MTPIRITKGDFSTGINHPADERDVARRFQGKVFNMLVDEDLIIGVGGTCTVTIDNRTAIIDGPPRDPRGFSADFTIKDAGHRVASGTVDASIGPFGKGFSVVETIAVTIDDIDATTLAARCNAGGMES